MNQFILHAGASVSHDSSVSHSIQLILVSDHFYFIDVIWKNKVYEFYKYIYD